MQKIILICSSLIAISSAGVLPAPQAYLATNTIHAAPATHIEYHHTPAIAYHTQPHYEIHAPAVGTSHKSITRTADGTVSQYSKAVDTAFSSVRKSDTRVSNKVYQPAGYNYIHHEPLTAYHQTIDTVPATKTTYLNAPQAHIAHYSPATLVSHVEYDAPLVHYAW